jgi:hypothetical protein
VNDNDHKKTAKISNRKDAYMMSLGGFRVHP